MAHKKAGGSTRLGRDSNAQRLGVKLHDGQAVRTGMVIVRQRGTKFIPGNGARIGKDDTIYAVREGVVKFETKRKIRFDGSKSSLHKVSVV